MIPGSRVAEGSRGQAEALRSWGRLIGSVASDEALPCRERFPVDAVRAPYGL